MHGGLLVVNGGRLGLRCAESIVRVGDLGRGLCYVPLGVLESAKQHREDGHDGDVCMAHIAVVRGRM